MPIPSGRPDKVLDAVKQGFVGPAVWPKAATNPEAHYQQMAKLYGYVAEMQCGFVLTDLGRSQIMLV
jgi:hypothetical protein